MNDLNGAKYREFQTLMMIDSIFALYEVKQIDWFDRYDMQKIQKLAAKARRIANTSKSPTNQRHAIFLVSLSKKIENRPIWINP